MDGTYASQMCARGFFYGFSGSTPVSSNTTALAKSYFKTWAQNCERIPAKTLVFQVTVTATGYYGIEDPLPNIISKLHRFGGLRSANC